MAMSVIKARMLLMDFVNDNETPPTPQQLVEDSFYVSFLDGKAAGDLPALNDAITNLKASAQRQI
jgi:hypothetical protein